MAHELDEFSMPKVEPDNMEPDLSPVSAFANARRDAEELAEQDALAAAASVETPDPSLPSHAAVFDPALDGLAQGPSEWLEGNDAKNAPDPAAGDGAIDAPGTTDGNTGEAGSGGYNERISHPVPVSRSFSTEARKDSQLPGRALLIEGIITLAIAIIGIVAVVSHGCQV